MENIHTILEKYGITVDEDKKADFDKALDLAITGKKGKSVKAVKALLDIDTLKASKNQRDDIDTALEDLKKDNG